MKEIKLEQIFDADFCNLDPEAKELRSIVTVGYYLRYYETIID